MNLVIIPHPKPKGMGLHLIPPPLRRGIKGVGKNVDCHESAVADSRNDKEVDCHESLCDSRNDSVRNLKI